MPEKTKIRLYEGTKFVGCVNMSLKKKKNPKLKACI